MINVWFFPFRVKAVYLVRTKQPQGREKDLVIGFVYCYAYVYINSWKCSAMVGATLAARYKSLHAVGATIKLKPWGI